MRTNEREMAGMEISPQVQERIDALCRQISVAHELDADIQKELRGHIKDKLLAYLSGEERLTEQDALILVRKQLRDPDRSRLEPTVKNA